jgi:hypothetical protein
MKGDECAADEHADATDAADEIEQLATSPAGRPVVEDRSTMAGASATPIIAYYCTTQYSSTRDRPE